MSKERPEGERGHRRRKETILYRSVVPEHSDVREEGEKGFYGSCKGSMAGSWFKPSGVKVGDILVCPMRCGARFSVKGLVPPIKKGGDGSLLLEKVPRFARGGLSTVGN